MTTESPTPSDKKPEDPSKTTDAPSGEEHLKLLNVKAEALVAEIKSHLKTSKMECDAIVALKNEATEALKKAEESRSKADQEARQAYGAKGSCEEHANAIAARKGNVDVDAAAISTIKKNADDIILALSNLRTPAEASRAAIEEARKRAEDLARQTESFKTEAESVNTQAGNANKQIEQISQRASGLLQSIEANLATTNTATTNSSAANAEIERLKVVASENTTATTQAKATVQQSLIESKTNSDLIKATVDMVKNTQDRVAAYENNLIALSKKYEQLHATVEGLIPQATSASLASAFREQRKRFKSPQKWWLVAFVFSLSCLIIIAIVTGVQYYSVGDDTWDAILRHLVQKLPLVVPFIWGAIYSGTHYMMSIRIEEDYAFKETLSTAFEGYKRELSGLQDVSADRLHPLIRMCENVLNALAERPGRIYEGKQINISPISSLAEIIKELGDAGIKFQQLSLGKVGNAVVDAGEKAEKVASEVNKITPT
jgi:hypothetical protein